MKRLFVIFIIFFSVSLLLLVKATSVSAKVLVIEKGFATIPEDETLDDDLFIGAETIEINGTVNGDVYAGAETVRVDGTINGDLHVGAGTVLLSGNVSDDVYVGAGNVSVSGAKIGGSLVVGTGNINVDKNSYVGGSLIAGAGSTSVYAPVKRNVMLGSGTVDLNSEVGGEVRIAAGNISIGPNTKIGKDLYYVIDERQEDISISESASISGMVKRVENKLDTGNMEAARKDFAKGWKTFNAFTKIISLIGALIVGFLWLRFLPKSFSKSSDIVRLSFFKSLGVGLLLVILSLPALLVLAITAVGLPLAGVLFLIFLLFIYLSKLVVGLTLGRWVSEKLGWKKISEFWVFAIGLTLLYLLKSAPFLGGLISLAVFLGGLGALVLYLKSSLSSK